MVGVFVDRTRADPSYDRLSHDISASHPTHRALGLHPVVSHAFRFWLWLTTGTITKQWVAVRRKHHAKVETPDDPHSPQVHGIARVLCGGVFFHAREARDRDVLERYGRGTPDDWLETYVYARCSYCGLFVMGFVEVFCLDLAEDLHPGDAAERVSMQPRRTNCCVGSVFIPGTEKSRQPLTLEPLLAKDPLLQTVYSMR